MKQGRKEEHSFVRDPVIAGMIDELNTITNPAGEFSAKGNYADACTLYLQAFKQCEAIIKTCEKRKKLSAISKLKNILAGIAYNLAYSAFMIDNIPDAIKYSTVTLSNPNKRKQAAELLAIIYNNTHNYPELIRYLDLDDIYKTFSVHAVYDAGVFLRNGGGRVERNSAQSLKYLLVAAKRRNTDPIFCEKINEAELYELIAQVYCEIGDPKNELAWRLKAVALNCPIALHNYAIMLAQGEATPKDVKKALGYHLRAADLGHVEAMNDAAVILLNKRNPCDEIITDVAKAESLLTLAADEHDYVPAMINLAGILFAKNDGNITTQQRIEKYCARGELNNNLEARNLRACLMMRECIANNQPSDEAIEIYQELALSGLGSAQYNLGIAFHVYEKGSISTAIYWYLEAINNGYMRAKDNLFLAIQSLVKKMPDEPKQVLKLLQSTLSQYTRMLPKMSRDTDSYVARYKLLIEELENGLNGEISEIFKSLFPTLHIELHKDIVSVNDHISAMANASCLRSSEKIKIILEYTLTSAMSTRNRTSALRDIAQIIAWDRHGAEALIDNLDLMIELVTKIAKGILDNEGFIELCVGLAKLKGHPESRLFKPCYDKLLAQLEDLSFLLTLKLTPTTFTTLMSCSSELAAEHLLTQAIIKFCANNYPNIAAELKPYQLFRCFQATCMNHATFSNQDTGRISMEMASELGRSLSRISPNSHSPIDLYQGYLSVLYLRRNRVINSDCIEAVELNFKTVFPRMLGWLQARKDKDIHSSRSQQQLATFLKRFRPDVEEEVFKHGLFVDIYFRNSKMIVDFDGPPHFLIIMPDEELPKIRRRKDTFHDRIHGLKALRIVYDDWDRHKDNATRLEFMQKKLLPYGIKLEAVTAPAITTKPNPSSKSRMRSNGV